MSLSGIVCISACMESMYRFACGEITRWELVSNTNIIAGLIGTKFCVFLESGVNVISYIQHK